MFIAKLDVELEQAIVRVLLGLTVMLFLLLSAPVQQWMLPAFSGFLLIAFLLIYSIHQGAGCSPWRILLGQSVDVLSVSVLLYCCGKDAVPLTGVYLWVIIGNGFRFGPVYMFSAILMANVCLVYIAFHEPFWREHQRFAVGIGVMQVIVPVDFALLLNRLKKARKELEFLSYNDGLTGLLNRRSFDKLLTAEILRLKRFPLSITVALVDIDHFKLVNDTYGHLVGDRVLKSVATVLKETCREADTVARFGGEEFVLLLPGLQENEKQLLGERFRKAVAHSYICHDGESVSVTVSIGMACWEEGFGSAEEWLQAADSALYHAKSQGRDRVVVSESLSGSINAIKDCFELQ